MGAIDINKYTPEQIEKLREAVKPRWNKYMTSTPTPKQMAFLSLTCLDAFYGGAAGGGKSEALLMAALQYVDQPGYNAIIIRKSYADLSLPGAIMDRARQYLSPFTDTKEVRWIDKLKTFIFPSGARLSFGFLDNESDKFKFQGAEFQFIGIDEATQISQSNFIYMFSRLRRNGNNPVPLRFRAASNPDSDAKWLYDRYVNPEKEDKSRIFIPANVTDNKHLNQEEYISTLGNLDPVTRAQLLNGDWTIKQEGGMFNPTWWKIIDKPPVAMRYVSAWDIASSDPNINKRADYTARAKIGYYRGDYYIVDVIRFRGTPSQVDQLIYETAVNDGKHVTQYIPIDPGSAGKIAFEHFKKLLNGYNVKGIKNTGSKIDRAVPMSSACEKGKIYLIRAPWNEAFVAEAAQFPSTSTTVHDDQIDAADSGFNVLAKRTSANALPLGLNGNSYWSRC